MLFVYTMQDIDMLTFVIYTHTSSHMHLSQSKKSTSSLETKFKDTQRLIYQNKISRTMKPTQLGFEGRRAQ